MTMSHYTTSSHLWRKQSRLKFHTYDYYSLVTDIVIKDHSITNTMPPPPIIVNSQVISGITGSISIACWIIVFAPQIYENFTRKSSEGLSLLFIILWLAGDVFNVLGSVLQGVLPTMIILAIYYTLADIVLLWQCLVYGNKNDADYIHLSPANPFDGDLLEHVLSGDERVEPEETEQEKPNPVKNFLFKTLMVSLVIMAGLAGWYISYVKNYYKYKHPDTSPELVYDPLAQFFGWLCAVLYLGSRIPQILLNFQRKSCDGISFMFFLFACLGNLTYVISILAIDVSWYYLWVNSSWLAGSLGTLVLDFTIFVQFFIYNEETIAQENHSNYGAIDQ